MKPCIVYTNMKVSKLYIGGIILLLNSFCHFYLHLCLEIDLQYLSPLNMGFRWKIFTVMKFLKKALSNCLVCRYAITFHSKLAYFDVVTFAELIIANCDVLELRQVRSHLINYHHIQRKHCPTCKTRIFPFQNMRSLIFVPHVFFMHTTAIRSLQMINLSASNPPIKLVWVLPDWPELNAKVINSTLMVYYNIGRDTLNDLFSLILVCIA